MTMSEANAFVIAEKARREREAEKEKREEMAAVVRLLQL